MNRNSDTLTEQSVLISNANNFSDTSADRREDRYERRRAAQRLTILNRFADCGRKAVGQVYIGVTEGKAHYTQIATCGSVWVCSVCSAKILAVRSIEIETAMEAWKARRGKFVFETLTTTHTKADSLEDVWDSVSKAFQATNGGSFSKTHKQFGQVGYLRVVEVTFGNNGWHVHLHVLRFIDEFLDATKLAEWSSLIFAKWSTALVSKGRTKPNPSQHRFELVHSPDDLHGYFAKGYDNSQVFAEGMLGEAHINTGKSTWSILDQAIGNPSSESRRNWNNWEKGSKGRRQISWSRGLRKLLGLSEPKSDEEIAEDMVPFTPVIGIATSSVIALGKLGRIQARVLRAVEKGDVETASQILKEHGIKHWLTGALPESVNTS